MRFAKNAINRYTIGRMRSVSVIIPTYNESKNIPILVEEIFDVLDKEKIDLEIIFVDDNSPDGTGKIAEELANKYPIKVVHRAGKLGLGSAVIAGFKASEREYLGVMDADLSHDPSILNQLITALDEYDITIGGRFEAGSEVQNWIWWRKLTSQVGVFFARLLTGVNDPLSGYFFFRRSVIDGVALTTVGYKILLEILVKGAWSRAKEIPFQFRIRKFSTSKLSTKEYWLFAKQLFSYTLYKIKK